MNKIRNIILLACFLMQNFNGFGQPVVLFNTIDSSELKQGDWIYYKTDTIINRWISIFDEDSVISENYLSGIDTVINYYYWKEGKYLNNFKTGLWKYYDYNTNTTTRDTLLKGYLRFEINFKEDSIDGIMKTFYPSGIVKCEVSFSNNKLQGQFIHYYENGKLKYSGDIVEGQDFFNGVEYYKTGSKYRDRKFNYNFVTTELIELDKILNEIK